MLDDVRVLAAEGPIVDRIARVLLCALPVLFVVGPSAADVALIGVAILFLVRAHARDSWQWLRTPWVVAALALWLYLIAISAGAGSWDTLASRALPFVRFVVFGAALQHWLFLDPRTRRVFLACLAAVVAFVVVDSLIQFYVGRDLFGRPYEDLRLSGPFDRNAVGAFLSRVSFVLLGLAFGWAAAAGRPLPMALAIAATLAVGLTVTLSGERGNLIMFGFGLFVLLVLLPGRRRFLLTAGAAAALVVGGAFLVSPNVFERHVGHTVADLEGFWDNRLGVLFMRGFEVWQESPIVGVGLKNFRNYCVNDDLRPIGPPENWCFMHPHQIYNEWLAETGSIGFAGFIALVALWVRELIPGLRSARADYALAAGACVAVLIFLWPLRPSMSFFSTWNAVLFWTMLGLALAVCAPRPLPERSRVDGSRAARACSG